MSAFSRRLLLVGFGPSFSQAATALAQGSCQTSLQEQVQADLWTWLKNYASTLVPHDSQKEKWDRLGALRTSIIDYGNNKLVLIEQLDAYATNPTPQLATQISDSASRIGAHLDHIVLDLKQISANNSGIVAEDFYKKLLNTAFGKTAQLHCLSASSGPSGLPGSTAKQISASLTKELTDISAAGDAIAKYMKENGK